MRMDVDIAGSILDKRAKQGDQLNVQVHLLAQVRIAHAIWILFHPGSLMSCFMTIFTVHFQRKTTFESTYLQPTIN